MSNEFVGEDFLRGVFAQITDPVQLHATALRSVTMDDEGAARHAMSVCRGLIEQRVLCRRFDAEVYATVTMVSSTWPESLAQEIGELFRAYIRADYVRLNDRVDAFGAESYSVIFHPGCTALEVAIRQKNINAAIILIEEGERTDFPSAQRYPSEPPYADQFELASALWDEPEMVARLQAAVMRRQIHFSGTNNVGSAIPASPRRRIGI